MLDTCEISQAHDEAEEKKNMKSRELIAHGNSGVYG